ncbi:MULTISPECIES: DUF4259 domain-containing protein [Microbacterium]|jgi:hypothetical protein|uniref:DUF4259 domain-containing protein n=1 Tax=Microbacterium TaxID=33882 RepID=UPI0023DA7A9D|nr:MULTISPECIES: DUF4259 domain-containing protein [Microbacterium]MDF2047236.1 DUF4259 domain-containing protein [Microbacterium sp. Kw_RZR3]MDQ1073928.1 hypothetical protein [Microbacterium sp. SORGH_AS_0969]MDQ1114157.1 hypothetical protein [Microbacterium testaceum]
MGTWSAKPFGNDSAADWAYELDDASDWSVVSDALRVATESAPADLDSDDAVTAIAAAEVVARGRGRVTDSAESVEAFVARVSPPSAELVDLAASALAVATSGEGELADLWEGDPEWLAENERLRAALTTD